MTWRWPGAGRSLHDRHTHPPHPRTARLGQPWPAHAGSGDHAARRQRRPRHRAGRRVHRHPRGAGAARRRRGLRRPGRAARVGPCARRDRRSAVRPRRRRPGRAGPLPDRARRHAGQDPARRQRDAGGVAGCRPCGGGIGRPAAVPPSGRRTRDDAAAAADPDLWRRRACRAQGRRPGLHGRVPGRGAASRRHWNGRPRSTALRGS